MRRILCLLVLIIVHAAPSAALGSSTTQTVSPRVILGVDPTGSQRYVQLADRGMPVFPTADVTCDGNRRTIPLTRSDSVGDKVVATYTVPPKISEEMLKAVECSAAHSRARHCSVAATNPRSVAQPTQERRGGERVRSAPTYRASCGTERWRTPGCASGKLLDVSGSPAYQRQLHHVFGRTVHLSHGGWAVLQQDEA